MSFSTAPAVLRVIICRRPSPVLLSRHSSNELNFFDHVGRAIVSKDLVKPHSWFTINVRPLPGIPWQVCLCLTLHESPVDHTNVVHFTNWQRTKEETTVSTRHVL